VIVPAAVMAPTFEISPVLPLSVTLRIGLDPLLMLNELHL
jgi:hypothetical protein